jgi:hypothetical protein
MFARAKQSAVPLICAGLEKEQILPVRFLKKLAFEATTTAVFGEKFAEEDVYTAFAQFDDSAHLLAGGVSWSFVPGVLQSFMKMGQVVRESAQEHTSAKAVRMREDATQNCDISEGSQKSIFNALFIIIIFFRAKN